LNLTATFHRSKKGRSLCAALSPTLRNQFYRLSALDSSLAVDFAFGETFFALTAAHLAFAASEMRFRPAALIFRVGAFAGLLVLAWIFAHRAFWAAAMRARTAGLIFRLGVSWASEPPLR
jgi:hypothetical protein